MYEQLVYIEYHLMMIVINFILIIYDNDRCYYRYHYQGILSCMKII